MTGKKYILDTCTIINFLSGKKNFLTDTPTADLIGISVISELEFLSSRHLSKEDISKYKEFLKLITIFDVSSEKQDFINLITEIRKSSNLKLPDCIIASTAIYNHSTLITSDVEFQKVKELSLLLI